jgi:hypothetical protein
MQTLQPLDDPIWPMDVPYLEKTIRRQSRFEKAMYELVKLSTLDKDDEIQRFYIHRSPDDVIRLLGWWNPVMNDRPKPFALSMLGGIPAPLSGKVFRWKQVGLMYYTPSIYKQRASRGRTTAAGLALLKHWAESRPKFKPFFESYYRVKFEDQIVVDCVDFCLGQLPRRFKDDQMKNAHLIEQDRKQRMSQAVKSFAKSPMQQASLAMAQQNYQNLMNPTLLTNQVNPYSVLLGQDMTMNQPTYQNQLAHMHAVKGQLHTSQPNKDYIGPLFKGNLI